MMKNDNLNLEQEKDFLTDSVTFYESKGFRPSIKEAQANFSYARVKPDFEENDFLDNSKVEYQVVYKIYLIGLAEYKTSLSFEQFLYFVFWNQQAWSTSPRRAFPGRWRYRDRRFNNHPFRKKHKFQQQGSPAKEESVEEEVRRSWREYRGTDKDKQRAHYRRGPYSHYDRILEHRKERRGVRTSLSKSEDLPTRITKNLIDDSWE